MIGGRLPTQISNLVVRLRIKNSDPPFTPPPGHPRGRGVRKYEFRLRGWSVGRPVKFGERAPHGFQDFPQKGYFDPHRSPRGGGDEKDFFFVIWGRLPTHISNVVVLLRIKNSDPPFCPTPRGTPGGRSSETTNFACPGCQSVGLSSLVSLLLTVSENFPKGVF